METMRLNKSRFSTLIRYSILVWTFICFTATWILILKYQILFKGLIALVMTFIFAAAAWMIPLVGLILLSLMITPAEERSHVVAFKDLIRKKLEDPSG